MIAKIAASAIWRPKLDETFLTPSFCAWRRLVRSFVSFVCSAGFSFLSRIWKLL